MSAPDEDAMEQESVVYKTLLESTKAIPWRIDWATKQFTYIGPQIGPLLGYSPESWLTVEDWAMRIHPDDRDAVVSFCVRQSESGVDHEADYRALTLDGGYVWIRDVVHVVRRGEQVEALVGFMFDISERKKKEEQLLRLQRDLEALSYKDGLTDIPNRRMFDLVLEREWASARRNGQRLSLVVVDIDHFKSFNDQYGHLAGDDCLKQVAGLLERCACRPRDFVARYGGEEFVLVLPETDEAAARIVAERCRRTIEEARIPHVGAPDPGTLTVSVGVGTAVAREGDDPRAFFGRVDALLYQAKQQGRNAVRA